MGSGARSIRLSVVIPALDEGTHIEATVRAVQALPGSPELVVVDGGSRDDTRERARRLGARVVDGPRGRGAQLHTGACAAAGEVLWFLHADTLPPADALAHIEAALRDPRTVGGNFSIRFDGGSAAARRLTWIYRHLRCLGLRYGDSGYFVRRDAYERAGGFRPLPIFEDLDLLRRLQRLGRFVRLPAMVVTSSRRFAGRSLTLVFAHWTMLQVLWWAGASPHWLGRRYRDVRVTELP